MENASTLGRLGAVSVSLVRCGVTDGYNNIRIRSVLQPPLNQQVDRIEQLLAPTRRHSGGLKEPNTVVCDSVRSWNGDHILAVCDRANEVSVDWSL